MQVVDIPKGAVKVSKAIDTSGARKLINYKEEWMQVYRESWRRMRDFFYAPNMHGVDWNVIKERYEVLVPHVNHRSDLTYVIGEMIGELNVGHAYSQNGEHPQAEKVYMGLLGAEFSKDSKSGYFRVDRILEGANWSKELCSPLTLPGVDVKEGTISSPLTGNRSKRLPIYMNCWWVKRAC